MMPLDDAALWLCRAAVSDGTNIPMVGPVGDAAELALNKSLQLDAARRAGFHVPATQHVDSVEDLMSLDTLPAVLKPVRPVVERDGVLVRPKNYVCASRSELAAVARTWAWGRASCATASFRDRRRSVRHRRRGRPSCAQRAPSHTDDEPARLRVECMRLSSGRR